MCNRRINGIQRIAPIRQAKGFTLIELMVVIAILGLVSSVALLGVRTPLAKARFANEVEQIIAMDAQARALATKGKNARVLFGVRDNSITLEGESTGRRIQLSANHQLRSVQSGVATGANGNRVEIRYGAGGTSQSYAINLSMNRGRSKWLVVMGLSGESYLLDESEWNNARITSLIAPRPNAG